MYHGPGIEAEPLVGEDGGGWKMWGPWSWNTFRF